MNPDNGDFKCLSKTTLCFIENNKRERFKSENSSKLMTSELDFVQSIPLKREA